MAIKLQDLKSTFSLDTNPLQAGAKLALVGVGALVAGIGIAAKLTMDWAADLDSLGDVMDGSNEKFAAMAFVARKSGVGVDALAKAGAKLNAGLLKQNGTLDVLGKKLKDYGISVKDANGNVKDSVQLTDEITKKYSELGTVQERVNFLTDIYGKQGKDLVDFFDTLAAEGGIDAVTEKVKALGLAIDPARYEQFNRNLEELKLVGLGLAVSFTEKIMPAVEGFLKLISNPKAISVSKIVDWAENTVSVWMVEMARGIENWANSDAPDQLTNSIVSWIDNIGNDDGTKSKLVIAAQRLGKSLIDAIKEIDWADIDAALDRLDEKILKSFDELDANIIATFDEWDAAILAKFDEWDAAINSKADAALKDLDLAFVNWSMSTWNTIKTWGANVLASMGTALQDLDTAVYNKQRDIAKTFFNGAVKWASQTAKGFGDNIGVILDAVESVVGEINKILNKIITSFTVNVQVGTVGTHNPHNPTPPIGEGETPRPIKPGKASGGTVMAGQIYPVNELGKSEYFIPSQNGRVEPNASNKPVKLDDDTLNALRMIFKELVLKGANA
jgi:hypothetical protein